MRRWKLKLTLILVACTFVGVSDSFAAKKKKVEEFKVQKSMLDAAERRLKVEADPYKRMQLILRWIKIKEEYENSLLKRDASPDEVVDFTASKKKIGERLKLEIDNYAKIKGLNLDILFREYAFRLLEVQSYADAYAAFAKITKRTAEDEIGYGDALLGAKQPELAIEAFSKAQSDARFRYQAAYKKAWAYLQLSDFPNSLANFNMVLDDTGTISVRLKEEAYRDRLRPYIETYSRPNFDIEEANRLRALAKRVHPTDPVSEKRIFVDVLKALIEGFNSKADILKAQAVFVFLSREIDDPSMILVVAAPLWLRVYRGQLDHDSMERIIAALPKKKIEGEQIKPLQAELHNTALFYETLVGDASEKDASQERAKKMLLIVYQKYFQLFPDDSEADPLRVNYARILLEGGDAGACLDVLAHRTGKAEATVEEVARNLEGRCQLKHLDQLYAQPHTDEFYKKLTFALLEQKVYDRDGLGVAPEQAFRGLTGMLIGALKKNVQAPILRNALRTLIEKFPYKKEEKQLHDLQLVSAELDFEDLVAEKTTPSEKSPKFFAIFQKAPKDSEVAQKALQNSVLTGSDKDTVQRCDVFKDTYPEVFQPKKEVFDRCIGLAEQNLDVEREYSYWIFAEKHLDRDQLLRVGLLELALDNRKGRPRLKGLRTEAADRILANWDGTLQSEKTQAEARILAKNDKRFKKLEDDAEYFLGRLKDISFNRIAKTVPRNIQDFEWIDGQLVKYSKAEPPAIIVAQLLELRAKLANRMRDWMKSLPEPPGLNEEEIKTYRTKAAQVVKPWEDRANQRIQECSETAYVLTPDFKQAATTVCVEKTPDTVFNAQMNNWQKTRQSGKRKYPWEAENLTDSEKTLKVLMEAGSNTSDPLKARYFLFRAYDRAKEQRDKAWIQLQLAKLTGKERFWLAAISMDGSLPEGIEYLRRSAEGNPFYTRLYDTQLELAKRNEAFNGSMPQPVVKPKAASSQTEAKTPKLKF